MIPLLGIMFALLEKIFLKSKLCVWTIGKYVLINGKWFYRESQTLSPVENLFSLMRKIYRYKYVFSLDGSMFPSLEVTAFTDKDTIPMVRTMFPLLWEIHLQAKLCSSTSVIYVFIIRKKIRKLVFTDENMFPIKRLQLFGKYSHQWKNYCF